MERKIRVAQYGIGRMGSIILKTMLDKGCEVVAAFARNPGQIGRDAGEVAGIGELGIPVSDSADARAVLRSTKPDICLIATKGTVAELEEAFMACIDSGVNALTIGEEAFWPWTTAAAVAARLDAAAKKAGVTLSASGYPDVFWGSMVTNVAGAMARVDRIHGVVMYDIDLYGSDFITGHGVGLTPEEFAAGLGRWRPEPGTVPCLPGDQNGWLCHELGLHVVDQTMCRKPKYSQHEIACRTTGETIAPGRVVGMSVSAETTTEEGLTIELEVCGKLYEEGETDGVVWKLSGVPDTEFEVRRPQTNILTCTTVVSRIPQVIAAPAGYATMDQLPPIRYTPGPLKLPEQEQDDET